MTGAKNLEERGVACINDNEKVQVFGEAVSAAERLSAPWRKAFFVSNVAHVIVEFFLAALCGLLIYFAYMAPVDFEQGQDFSAQTQSQSYSESAAHGG